MLNLIKSRRKDGGKGSKGKRGSNKDRSVERTRPKTPEQSFDHDHGYGNIEDLTANVVAAPNFHNNHVENSLEPELERRGSRDNQEPIYGERPSSRNSLTGSKRSRQPRLGTGTSAMNTYLFEDDPGIMSEVETSSTRHRRVSGQKTGNPVYGASNGGRTTPSGRPRSSNGQRTFYDQYQPPPSLHDDDPGIMSEAETASTTRGSSKRGRSRNSIPMGSLTLNSRNSGSQRTVQFRQPIVSQFGGPPSSTLFEDDPGIMSEAETSSTPGRRRQLLRSNSAGNRRQQEFSHHSQKHALPVVRTPSKTLERPLGLVFLVYRGETKRALLPNEITSIFTVKALFVRSFAESLTMEYMDNLSVKIYIHDSGKDIFYELENLAEIKDRTILKLFEGDGSGRGPSGLGPGGLPPITNAGDELSAGPSDDAEPEYVDSRYVKAMKAFNRNQKQEIYGRTTSAAAASSTLPRNAFSALDQERAAGNNHVVFQEPVVANNRRMNERSKTLGPGFMRVGNARNQQQEEYGDRYHTFGGSEQPRSIPSRFSTIPEASRYYTGPGSTEEAKERMMHMEAQLNQLTGMVEKALKNKKLGKKTVSFDKAVSFSDDKPQGILTNKHRHDRGSNSSLNSYHRPPSASPTPRMMSPELYNQLRGLQRSAKDLRQEVKIIRRLTLLQSMAMKDLVQDTYLKLREACITFSTSQSGTLNSNALDLEQWKVAQDEELFSRELNELVQQISQLEAKVEEMRSGVINKKNKIGLADVESMSLVLSKSSKTVTHLKQAFPTLENNLRGSSQFQQYLQSDKTKVRAPSSVLMTEEFLKRTPERLENVWRRCKKLTGTLVTLKRLASVQEQRFHPGTSIVDVNVSLSPTPSEMSRISLDQHKNNKHVDKDAKESTLDDLLDALQNYSGGTKKEQNLIRQRGNYILQQLQQDKDSPMKKGRPLSGSDFGDAKPRGKEADAAPSTKTAPPPPPPRTSSTAQPIRSASVDSSSDKLSKRDNSGSESTTSESSESLNSQEGHGYQLRKTTKPQDIKTLTGKTKQEALETRHQELLTRQKQLQEQYERLQQMQQKKAANSDTKNKPVETTKDELKKTVPTSKVMPNRIAVESNDRSLGSSGNETEESSNPDEENSTSSNNAVVLPGMGKDTTKPNRPVGRVPPALPARGNSTLTTVAPEKDTSKKIYETDMI